MTLTEHNEASIMHLAGSMEHEGQFDMGWDNHDEQFHQGVEDLMKVGDIPLEIKSAGLFLVETYRHVAPATAC
jgi:hypothetical protein